MMKMVSYFLIKDWLETIDGYVSTHGQKEKNRYDKFPTTNKMAELPWICSLLRATPKNGWFDIHSVFATHVETVILLSRKAPDAEIKVRLDMSELDITSAESNI